MNNLGYFDAIFARFPSPQVRLGHGAAITEAHRFAVAGEIGRVSVWHPPHWQNHVP